MLINFAKNSNRLFTKVFHLVRRAKTRYIVVYGGAASSKSYSVHQSELINIMHKQEAGDTLVIRKYCADIRDSSYKLFQNLIDEYKLTGWFRQTFSHANRRITYTPTGRSIIFRGCDNPEKLKSIFGIKRIVIEEASQLTFEDFLEINRRARGIQGIQIIFILNPVSEFHWIKTKLCDDDSPYRDETTVFCFTYHDNVNAEGKKFVTGQDIKELERLREISENNYNIYTLANWGVEDRRQKFCWAFKSSQVKPTTLNPDTTLWASFDFNVNPVTCTLAQVYHDVKTICVIDCLKLENSNIWALCDRLKTLYPDVLWGVTGDAIGKARSALTPDNINYYTVIRKKLSLVSGQFFVPSSNPKIEKNKLLVNAIHEHWTVEIDPVRCQDLIYDLTYVEVDENGKMLKNRSSQKKCADFLDTWRYLLNATVSQFWEF